MYSIIPVHEDRAGAIITLVGLGHERRGYAGIPEDTRRHGIQAGYVELISTTCIHINLPMQIRLPVFIRRRVAAFKQQIDEAFYLYEQDESTGNFDLVPQDRQDSLY